VTTRAENILEVRNLQTHFRTDDGLVKAVDGVSFSVKRGETLGIVGESGSGKSVTCLSAMQLVPRPPAFHPSGEIHFGNADLLSLSEHEIEKLRGERLAMIFQDPLTSLNPYLTIARQLTEVLEVHRNATPTTARRTSIEMLERVGIPDAAERIDQHPHQFSGGMRQRVMIAMALITEPKLLICDEPTTALDVTIQAQILRLVKQLQQQRNIAVIFISHDLAVVAGVADKVAVMKGGVIIEQGPVEDIFHRTQHEYTKKLLASIPEGAKPELAASISDSPANEFLLEARKLRTHFQDHSGGWFKGGKKIIKAVEDVSLNIRRGEILGLVGESGSGKSTLGRSILQLVPTTSGSVLFDNINLTQLSKHQMKSMRRRMQMIFQDPYASLNPRMSVFDTLAEPLLYHGLAIRKNVTGQVLTLMDEVGLARSAIRKYPHEFSGGQRQRIAIGRTIATKPELVIADEPVSALDVTIQAQILDLILTLVEKHNLTMLFISHDLSVVRYIADRVAVMHHGKLVEIGDTETLFANPEHDYTKKLLSAIPVADPVKERERQLAALS